MPSETIEAYTDKTTKNKKRFQVTSANVSGSLYLPKEAENVRVTIEWD